MRTRRLFYCTPEISNLCLEMERPPEERAKLVYDSGSRQLLLAVVYYQSQKIWYNKDTF